MEIVRLFFKATNKISREELKSNQIDQQLNKNPKLSKMSSQNNSRRARCARQSRRSSDDRNHSQQWTNRHPERIPTSLLRFPDENIHAPVPRQEEVPQRVPTSLLRFPDEEPHRPHPPTEARGSPVRKRTRRPSSNAAGPSSSGVGHPRNRESSSQTAPEPQQAPKRSRKECARCLRVFGRRIEAENHQKTCTKTFSCSKCDYNTPYATSMERHKSKHAEIQCPECPNKYYSKEALTNHMRVHRAQRSQENFMCTRCNKTYTRNERLQDHIIMTHPEMIQRYLGCPHCSLSFPTTQGLNAHIGIKHPETRESGRSRCGICGKVYSRRYDRDRHMQKVHGIGE